MFFILGKLDPSEFFSVPFVTNLQTLQTQDKLVLRNTPSQAQDLMQQFHITLVAAPYEALSVAFQQTDLLGF
jgi:hypothetical protein